MRFILLAILILLPLQSLAGKCEGDGKSRCRVIAASQTPASVAPSTTANLKPEMSHPCSTPIAMQTATPTATGSADNVDSDWMLERIL